MLANKPQRKSTLYSERLATKVLRLVSVAIRLVEGVVGVVDARVVIYDKLEGVYMIIVTSSIRKRGALSNRVG